MQAEIYVIIGQLAVYAIIILLVMMVLTAVLIAVSIRRHHFYFPNFSIAVLIFFQGFFKALFRFVRLDDTAIDQLYVNMTLAVREREFFKVPPDKRAVFFPQCLRSVDCPAPLTPEGIICEKCGRCRLGEAKDVTEENGHLFFIVPGSSFIKRAIAKNRPAAVLGIGCLIELKEGAEMTQRYGLPSYAVQLDRAGCINTTIDWDQVFEALTRYDGKKRVRKTVKKK